MTKQIRASYFHNFKNAQYCALTSDIENTLPDYLKNGDQIYVIDTGKSYLYNEATSELIEEPTIGMLSGGFSNQFLMKNSADNYDMSWQTIADLSTVSFEVDNDGILNVIAESV